MIPTLYQWFKSKILHWRATYRSTQNPQRLYSRRIYILPTAFGCLYGVIILSILTGAINYQVNTAYFFVFLLMNIGLLTIWQTHQNLKGISIQCMLIDDVEQGKPASLKLYINAQRQHRFSLVFTPLNNKSHTIEEVPITGSNVVIPLATEKRGKHLIPPIKIFTSYPLGIFGAWSTLYFDMEYYVYPYAITPGFWPDSVSETSDQDKLMNLNGEDELYELKSIDNPWVQPGKIAWKISARGQGWYLKTMTSPAGEYWLFRLNDLTDADIEICLQQLSYWIQAAERQKQVYALELDETTTDFSCGEAHMKRCLRRLAMY